MTMTWAESAQAADEAWFAMLRDGVPITDAEYEAIPGLRFSLVPLMMFGEAIFSGGRPVAVKSIRVTKRVDYGVCEREYSRLIAERGGESLPLAKAGDIASVTRAVARGAQ